MSKAVLISGCSTGIGYAAAKDLQARGYRVFASARRSIDVERLKKEGFEAVQLDVSDSESIKQAVAHVLAETQGQLYALINNAGYGIFGALEDLDRQALREQFETNVFGLQELTNAVLPTMRQQGYGRIIHVSSIVGVISMGYMGAYSASKFAVEALADSQRLELHGSNIYISVIQPGPIETQFFSNAQNSYEQHVADKAQQSVHRHYYNKRVAEGADKKQAFALQTDAVVSKIVKAIESKQPKRDYQITLVAKLMPFVKRLLPRKLYDALMLKVMALK